MEQEGLPQSDLMEDIGIPRPHQIHIPTLESKYRSMQREKRRGEWRASLPCESAPVWHCGQFQSSNPRGVSITRLAGRSKIVTLKFGESLAARNIRLRNIMHEGKPQNFGGNNDVRHCTQVEAGTAGSRKNLLTGRMVTRLLASSRPRNYPNSFSIAVPPL